jgi:hypothetical protein
LLLFDNERRARCIDNHPKAPIAVEESQAVPTGVNAFTSLAAARNFSRFHERGDKRGVELEAAGNRRRIHLNVVMLNIRFRHLPSPL